jgi:RNA polymerase sigma-70 factor (ECF subfamily)
LSKPCNKHRRLDHHPYEMGNSASHDPSDDQARLEAIFLRHYGDVVRYVRRRAEPDLVEDVVSETFLVAWRRLDAVPADARPWLLGVAHKTLATQRRSARRRASLLSTLERLRRPASIGNAGESGVAEALARLSEKDREAITLVAWDGLTPAEAAAVLGQSPAAFRVRLHRAKRRLRQLLEIRGRPASQETAFPVAAEPLTKGD